MLQLLLLAKAGIEASASSGCSEPSLLRCSVCVVTARQLLVEDGGAEAGIGRRCTDSAESACWFSAEGGGLEESSLGWGDLAPLKGFSFFRACLMASTGSPVKTELSPFGYCLGFLHAITLEIPRTGSRFGLRAHLPSLSHIILRNLKW